MEGGDGKTEKEDGEMGRRKGMTEKGKNGMGGKGRGNEEGKEEDT